MLSAKPRMFFSRRPYRDVCNDPRGLVLWTEMTRGVSIPTRGRDASVIMDGVPSIPEDQGSRSC